FDIERIQGGLDRIQVKVAELDLDRAAWRFFRDPDPEMTDPLWIVVERARSRRRRRDRQPSVEVRLDRRSRRPTTHDLADQMQRTARGGHSPDLLPTYLGLRGHHKPEAILRRLLAIVDEDVLCARADIDREDVLGGIGAAERVSDRFRHRADLAGFGMAVRTRRAGH